MEIFLVVLIILISIVLVLIFITGKNKEVAVSKEYYALGTIINFSIFGKKAEKAIEEALNRIKDIEDKMSVFKSYSEISKINKNAGGQLQKVSQDTFYVIKKAINYCKLSSGAFDITIRPVVFLWGIGSESERIPQDIRIKERLKLVNYNDIVLDEVTSLIGLKNENQQIDLGGIAKGYAADEVKNILIKNGVTHGIINLGGNIYVLGNKINGEKWTIGIQDPLGNRGEFIGTIMAANKSIVTSGNYERFFEVDGKRYHHIIDPRTGYPSQSEIISVTVISDLSIDGDGLSTGLYVMGLTDAYKLVQALPGIEAIFVTEDKKIYLTEGIKENFKLVNEAENKYKIYNS